MNKSPQVKMETLVSLQVCWCRVWPGCVTAHWAHSIRVNWWTGRWPCTGTTSTNHWASSSSTSCSWQSWQPTLARTWWNWCRCSPSYLFSAGMCASRQWRNWWLLCETNSKCCCGYLQLLAIAYTLCSQDKYDTTDSNNSNTKIERLQKRYTVYHLYLPLQEKSTMIIYYCAVLYRD